MNERWALVTGASRGIGRATAVALAGHGYNVGIGYLRNESAAADVAREIESRGRTPVLLRGNVARSAECADIVTRFTAAAGRVDAFVHAAALGAPASLLDARTNRFTLAWDTHVRGFLDLVRAARASFAPGASVVALTSIGTHHVFPGYGPIAMAKGALEVIVRYLAQELAPVGVRVNGVCGGPVDTDSLRSFPGFAAIEQECARRPCGRLGTPEDLAPVIVWLLGEESQWMRGQVVVADGGFGLV